MTRPGWRSRGYLPHCDEDGLVQHIVFRLADSLPKGVRHKMALLGAIDRYKAVERMLDAGDGEAVLKNPQAAQIVNDALLQFDGERYALLAWCVMPNHVHVVIEPLEDYLLSDIIKSWKAFSAARINAVCGRSGRLWAAEYFDRFMRSDEHLTTTIAYVENNPVAAGLCRRPEQWAFSSAAWRAV
jgi:REP element-mobilizing transposase RayT